MKRKRARNENGIQSYSSRLVLSAKNICSAYEIKVE